MPRPSAPKNVVPKTTDATKEMNDELKRSLSMFTRNANMVKALYGGLEKLNTEMTNFSGKTGGSSSRGNIFINMMKEMQTVASSTKLKMDNLNSSLKNLGNINMSGLPNQVKDLLKNTDLMTLKQKEFISLFAIGSIKSADYTKKVKDSLWDVIETMQKFNKSGMYDNFIKGADEAFKSSTKVSKVISSGNFMSPKKMKGFPFTDFKNTKNKLSIPIHPPGWKPSQPSHLAPPPGEKRIRKTDSFSLTPFPFSVQPATLTAEQSKQELVEKWKQIKHYPIEPPDITVDDSKIPPKKIGRLQKLDEGIETFRTSSFGQFAKGLGFNIPQKTDDIGSGAASGFMKSARNRLFFGGKDPDKGGGVSGGGMSTAGRLGAVAGQGAKLGSSIMSGMGKALSAVLGTVMKVLGPILSIFEPISEVMGMFAELIGTAFLPIITELMTLMFSPEVMEIITGIMAALEPLVAFVVKFIETLAASGVIAKLGEILVYTLSEVFKIFEDPAMIKSLSSVVSLLATLADAVLPMLGPMISVISLLLLSWAAMFNNITIPVLRAVIKFIGDVFVGIFGIINKGIDTLNNLPGVDIKPLSITLPPSLDRQGIIEKTGMAKVHAGEAVVRKELISEIVNDMNVTNNFYGNVNDIQRMEFESSMENIYSRRRRR